jgi:hypothetical protein
LGHLGTYPKHARGNRLGGELASGLAHKACGALRMEVARCAPTLTP